jgi:hypothetical protein
MKPQIAACGIQTTTPVTAGEHVRQERAIRGIDEVVRGQNGPGTLYSRAWPGAEPKSAADPVFFMGGRDTHGEKDNIFRRRENKTRPFAIFLR